MVDIKSIEEIKDEVAKQYKYTSFYQMLIDGGVSMNVLNKRIDEAIHLYAQQFKK